MIVLPSLSIAVQKLLEGHETVPIPPASVVCAVQSAPLYMNVEPSEPTPAQKLLDAQESETSAPSLSTWTDEPQLEPLKMKAS